MIPINIIEVLYASNKKETIILSDNIIRIRRSYFARRFSIGIADFFKNSRMDLVYRRSFYFDVRRMRNGTYRVRYGNALDDIRASRYIVANSNRRHGRCYYCSLSRRYFGQKNRVIQPRNDEKRDFRAKCKRYSPPDRVYNQGDFLIELIGALVMMPVFCIDYGAEGIWLSIFHSVSAFCNAGFDIMGTKSGEFTSITHYSAQPVINITIMLLIIIGGIGFWYGRMFAKTSGE